MVNRRIQEAVQPGDAPVAQAEQRDRAEAEVILAFCLHVAGKARLAVGPQRLHAPGVGEHALGERGLAQLLSAFVTAWESRNIDELVRLFAEDARFTMPPLPAWFDGREFVEKFIVERVFATPWRMLPLRANGQVGFACYMQAEGGDRFRLAAVTLLSLRAGRIAGLHSFLDPAVHRRFGLVEEIA